MVEPTSKLRQFSKTVLTFAIAVLGLAMAQRAFAAVAPDHKHAGNLTVYVGTLPAQLVREHPPGHVESTMHGGAPQGSSEYHLVVAVFEGASGARVSDAKVSATVSGLGHVGSNQVNLEPMTIANTVTYGGFVALPKERATITVQIKRPEQPSPVRVDFDYEPEGP